MSTITCRIPDTLDAALTALARHRRVAKSLLVREALARQVRRGTTRSAPTAYEVARALCGALRGPADLSTNAAHLEDLGA